MLFLSLGCFILSSSRTNTYSPLRIPPQMLTLMEPHLIPAASKILVILSPACFHFTLHSSHQSLGFFSCFAQKFSCTFVSSPLTTPQQGAPLGRGLHARCWL